jgi:hypothetical protein
MSHFFPEFHPGDYVFINGADFPAYQGHHAYVRDYLTEWGKYIVAVDEVNVHSPPMRPPSCKLQRANKQKVKTRICDFINGGYACLGVSACRPAHAESRIDPNSALGKLARPPIKDLPGPDSTLSVFRNAQTEALYREIYGGAFIAVWNHDLKLGVDDVFPAPNNWTRKLDIHIDVYLPGNEQVRVGSFSFTSGRMGPYYCYEDIDYAIRHNSWNGLEDMTTSQRTALSIRVIHLLLRVVGCDIGCWGCHALGNITNYYKENSRWEELLDISITLADIVVQMSYVDTLLVHDLGPVLTASGLYRAAAALYGELCTDSPNAVILITYLNERADAFHSIGDYDKAEVLFFEALRLFLTQPIDPYFVEFREEKMVRLLSSVVVNYTTWYTLHGPSTNGDAAVLLMGCIAAAGLLKEDDLPGPSKVYYLDPRLSNNQVAARQAVLAALSESSLEGVYATARTWKRANTNPIEFWDVRPLPSAMEEFRAGELATYRREKVSWCELLTNCDNPSCSTLKVRKNLRRCPCASVNYCSHSCQKGHWKSHKLVCAWHASKNLPVPGAACSFESK